MSTRSMVKWVMAAVIIAGGACGDDATPGDSSTADTGGDSLGADATDTVQADTAANDTEEADTNPADTSGDPEGTRYPIAVNTGAALGNFETNLAAAFDGVVAQTAAQSAQASIYEAIEDAPQLYKEFDCELRLRRLEVHPPSDGPLLHDANNYPTGGTGKVKVVARRADSDYWYPVSEKAFGKTGSVVFGPADLENQNEYVAFGVSFSSDEPLVGTLRVAEVALFGYCAGPSQTIAWSTTPWLCTGVECVTESNEGGVERRTVTCERSSGGYANDALCAGEKPAEEGAACALTCSYHLKYVGMKPFTYDNGSGWLHEGNVERRAGPLPSSVSFATTYEAIEGKPCSIKTEKAETYFVGLSCTVEGDTTNYCAFRCE